MHVLGHHGSCTVASDGQSFAFIISCTDASATALNSAIQPSPDVASKMKAKLEFISIITNAVVNLLMAATSMTVAVAWCRDRSRKHTAPIYDNETGNEAGPLLGRVN
jgi:hypothetical protein